MGKKRLAGKVAWVTGSSRGLGRGIAAHLADLGASVAVHGTSPTSTRAFDEADSLEAVAQEIAGQTGSPTMAVWGDLTDAERVKRSSARSGPSSARSTSWSTAPAATSAPRA